MTRELIQVSLTPDALDGLYGRTAARNKLLAASQPPNRRAVLLQGVARYEAMQALVDANRGRPRGTSLSGYAEIPRVESFGWKPAAGTSVREPDGVTRAVAAAATALPTPGTPHAATPSGQGRTAVRAAVGISAVGLGAWSLWRLLK